MASIRAVRHRDLPKQRDPSGSGGPGNGGPGPEGRSEHPGVPLPRSRRLARAAGVAVLAGSAVLAVSVPAAAHGGHDGGITAAGDDSAPHLTATATATLASGGAVPQQGALGVNAAHREDVSAEGEKRDGSPGSRSAKGSESEAKDSKGGQQDDGDAKDDSDSGDEEDNDVEPPTDEELEELEAEIEELRDQAGEASERHEKLRRTAGNQQTELETVRAQLRNERTRLSSLRTMIGKQASQQYRTGGGSAGLAKLMFAQSVEDFLNSSSLIGRGELTARQLMERSQESEERLVKGTAEAKALRESTAELAEEQRELREKIEKKLERAEERLEELEEARALAEKKAAKEKAAREALEAAERAAEKAAGMVDGACVVSVRDSEDLAEPAVEEPWTLPVEKPYQLTAGYGRSGDRWSNGHTGQDFAVATGTPILTIGDGTVVSTGCDDGFGHQIVIEHENGYYSQYAHLSVIEVEPGQQVGAGQRIGLSGDTGNSSGPHLHFEIRLTPYLGSAVNPVPWLEDHDVKL